MSRNPGRRDASQPLSLALEMHMESAKERAAEIKALTARLGSAVMLLRRVRAEEDLPSDEERQFQLDDDIDAFLGAGSTGK